MKATRRTFLGSVVVPLFLPRLAFGANDRLNFAFIGCGRRAEQLRPKGANVVAVCDVYRERVEQFAKDYQAQAYKDYRGILDRHDVDAVIIATPDHWHALPMIHACQAGKDVYVEKPLGMTVVESRKMVEAARKYKRVVQVGTQQRSMLPDQIACEIVRKGMLGKRQKAICFSYWSAPDYILPAEPTPDGLDWDMWLGQASERPYNSKYIVSQPPPYQGSPGWMACGGFTPGQIVGSGSHGFDMIQLALGMDGTGPVEVEAGSEGSPLPIRWAYANGVTIETGSAPREGGRICCERGEIEIRRNKFKISPKSLEKEVLSSYDVRKKGAKEHIENFMECIRTRERPNADVAIGHTSQIVGHIGAIARLVPGKLRWNPETERFLGNEKANALLDRARRKKYELPAV